MLLHARAAAWPLLMLSTSHLVVPYTSYDHASAQLHKGGVLTLPPSVPCNTSCYARLDGPVITWGICATGACCGNTTATNQYRITLRVVGAHQVPAGNYLLWVSCMHMEALAGPPRSAGAVGPKRSVIDLRGASVGAFKEYAQIDGSPFSLQLEEPLELLGGEEARQHSHGRNNSRSHSGGGGGGGSNSEVRGEGSAARCHRGDSPGWWVARGLPGSERAATPGHDADFWRDTHVWAPHGCSHESFSRSAAIQCVSEIGTMLLFGDSMMRGIFCDLDNWLRLRLRKDSLPPYVMDLPLGNSSWDEKVCGFNGKTRLPGATNGECTGHARSESFLPERLSSELISNGSCSKHRREFKMSLRNAVDGNSVSGAESATIGYVEALGLHDLVPKVGLLVQLGFKTVDGSPVRAIAIHSCLWDYRARRSPEAVKKFWKTLQRLLRDFEGTVVLLPCPSLHKLEDIFGVSSNVSIHGSMHAQMMNAVANHSLDTKARWHVLDMMSMGMARPDRTLDAQHMFPRKCTGAPGWQGRLCAAGTRDVRSCCLPADSFPNSVSFSVVLVMLNLFCAANGQPMSNPRLSYARIVPYARERSHRPV